MQFKLLGFSQEGTVRQFLFQRNDDGTRSPCTVIADLALARQFDLTVQDLPLLCARLLQAESENEPLGKYALTAEQMRVHSAEIEAVVKLDAEKSASRSRRSALALAARRGADSAPPIAAGSDSGAGQLLGGSVVAALRE